jgi:hypothetical protein
VKELISENKRAFYNWKQIGRPKDENSIEYIEMKRCNRQLRNQIRTEEHEDKLNFYNNLTNQIQKHFPVLLKKIKPPQMKRQQW